MATTKFGEHQYDDSDEVKDAAAQEGSSGRAEFDCPTCNANNPTEAIIRDGDELTCNYCGEQWLISLSEGRMRFKEL
jgi:hypothetical protein